MKGYMYILLCSNGQYYTGSTNNTEMRLAQHQNGEGSNFTRKHLPVKLVYFEEFEKIDDAFRREKQVQGWSRKKKEALIRGENDKLPKLSKSKSLRQAQGPPRTLSLSKRRSSRSFGYID
ncbi:MAG: GIY-YIG nuclease family protein [Smithellaceae bacterium]